jgi:hypothetical protein
MENTTIKTREIAEKEIREILTKIDESELVSIWNDFCMNDNRYDDEIMDYCTLEEYISNAGDDTMQWLNRFYFGSDDYSDESGSANPNRNYFTFNGYGNIISFDYLYNEYTDKFNYIDDELLIDYIIDNQESFSNDDIQEIIDALEDIED